MDEIRDPDEQKVDCLLVNNVVCWTREGYTELYDIVKILVDDNITKFMINQCLYFKTDFTAEFLRLIKKVCKETAKFEFEGKTGSLIELSDYFIDVHNSGRITRGRKNGRPTFSNDVIEIYEVIKLATLIEFGMIFSKEQ